MLINLDDSTAILKAVYYQPYQVDGTTVIWGISNAQKTSVTLVTAPFDLQHSPCCNFRWVPTICTMYILRVSELDTPGFIR